MSLQPTNAGIDYQQRVSALFLVSQLMDIPIQTFTSIGVMGEITRIKLEGDEHIDDLIVLLDGHKKLLFQLKRRISFSIKDDSEFVSVINQFVKQFNLMNPNEHYILATSSDSSKMITQRLRRIFNVIRTSDGIDFRGTFNNSDNNLLRKLETLIQNLYTKIWGEVLSQENLYMMIKLIHVEILDVEEGQMVEKNILLLLSQSVSVEPIVLWRAFIASSLSFASNRQTVTKKYLMKVYGNYFGAKSDSDAQEIIINTDFAVDRDILLCKSNDLQELIGIEKDERTLFIIELFRFENSGEKRITYIYPNKAILNNNRCELELIYRAATYVGIERFIDNQNNQDLVDNHVVRVLAANDEYKSKDDRGNRVHLDWMRNNAVSNTKENKCINCKTPLFVEQTMLIEIDCADTEPRVGGIHEECLVPTDRVLGHLEMPHFSNSIHIKNFDYNKWIDVISKSCSVFNAKVTNQPVKMLWDQHYKKNMNADYVIKINLENGDYAIVTKRGKVQRFSYNECKESAREFDQFIKARFKENEPQCYSSDYMVFGDYRMVQNVEGENEPIACISAEAVKYNQIYSECFDLADNYYAPLIYFVEDNKVVAMKNSIFMLSDVTRYVEFVKNWNKLQIDIRKFKAIVIDSDDEFDKFVYQARADNMRIIVDPKFGRYNELISGYFIDSLQDFIRE